MDLSIVVRSHDWLGEGMYPQPCAAVQLSCEFKPATWLQMFAKVIAQLAVRCQDVLRHGLLVVSGPIDQYTVMYHGNTL